MSFKLIHKLIFLIGFSILVSACDKNEQVEEPPLRSVKYVEVGEGSAQRTRTFSGVSKSELEAKLSFKVAGTLITLNVSVGDTLETGQLIAELDPSTYQLQEQQAQAELTRATAERRNAESAYSRTKELYENQNASKNDLDTARAAFESSEALVNSAQKAVDIATLNVSYTKLAATESCSVASTSTETGENVTAGQEIILVNCGDELKVDVSVPENLISAMKSGMHSTIVFDSVPDSEYTGSVTEIGVAGTGTTFPVSVRLDDNSGLRSGLAAQVTFSFESAAAYPIVPVSAVGEDQQSRFVYLLTPGEDADSGIIKRQSVEVGKLVTDGLEVTDGLNVGDKVVTAGVSVIEDGLVVKAN